MRHNPKILIALAIVGLAACASEENTNTAESALPDEVTNAPEAAPEPVADAETSTWAVGGTIPHDRPGVPDIQILEVRENGTGPVCGNGKSATLAYKAMTADGTVLDPGTRPYTFTVGTGNAIDGWHVMVAQMRVGDDFTILLPQQLAYGPQRGDLKFDMKLLSFE